MEYFCYISRSKVDQLCQSYGLEDSDEVTETTTTERSVEANAGADVSVAKILELFKAGITYGRKGTLQRERKIKASYVTKLHQVLRAIEQERPILSFTRSVPLATGEPELYRWYHHRGFFSVETPLAREDAKSGAIVTICTDVLSHKLLLDCSLRFFSEGNEPDGQFALNSSNYRFFTDGMALGFETIFMVLGKNGADFVGTPLFLLLRGDEGGFSVVL